VLPRGHALDDIEAIQLAQLCAERIILYARQGAPELFDAIIAMCRRAKFSPNIVDTPCLWQPVLTMVEAAEGIALVPACVQHLRSNGYHSELCVTKDVRWMWCWRGVRVIPTRSAKAS
jgi:DNA-binding transcriptional LysR family regulator